MIETPTERIDLLFIDAAPAEDFPLRVLRRYLELEESSFVSDNSAGQPPTNPLLIMLNEQSKKRAEALRSAIKKLTE